MESVWGVNKGEERTRQKGNAGKLNERRGKAG